jgi:uncharacterized protein
MFNLLPKEEKFFESFASQAGVLHEAAGILLEMLDKPGPDAPEKANNIKKLEHRSDNMTHDVIVRLNRTFITPLDREDIHALCSRLDDVLDLTDAAASRIVLYKIFERKAPAVELARVLQRATKELQEAVPNILNQRERILEHCQEIIRLEHEADHICRNGIAQLFEIERDPFQLIKWKEIYEVLEGAVDKAEDVANVLETIVLKSS